MKRVVALLMVLALAVVWMPIAQASCCAADAPQGIALNAASCCDTACPSHLQACEPDAAMQENAVAAPPLRLVDLVTPDGQASPSVTVRPAIVTIAFHPDDRAFPEARFALTKTYRL